MNVNLIGLAWPGVRDKQDEMHINPRCEWRLLTLSLYIQQCVIQSGGSDGCHLLFYWATRSSPNVSDGWKWYQDFYDFIRIPISWCRALGHKNTTADKTKTKQPLWLISSISLNKAGIVFQFPSPCIVTGCWLSVTSAYTPAASYFRHICFKMYNPGSGRWII